MRLIRRVLVLLLPTLFFLGVILLTQQLAHANDFMIQSIYRALDMGGVGENPQKDYYLNMGTKHGLQEGSVVGVLRRNPIYDASTKKLFKDITYPIARLKVIHSEGGAAVARLDKMYPREKTPAANPYAVMVGDLVRLAN